VQIKSGYPGQPAGAAKAGIIVLKAIDSAPAGAQAAFPQALCRFLTAFLKLSTGMKLPVCGWILPGHIS